MSASAISCPYCGEPLRVQDRKLIGATVKCPECRSELQVVSDGPHSLNIKPQSHLRSNSKSKRRMSWIGLLRDPQVVAWVVAACMGVLFVCTIIVKSTRRNDATNVALADERKSPAEALVGEQPRAENISKKGAEPAAPQVAPQPALKRVAPVPQDIPAEPPVVAHRPPAEVPTTIEPPPLPDEPPVVAVRPDPVLMKPADVAAALALPIISFVQVPGAPLRELLQQVEEMAGVPIRFDEKELSSASVDLDEKIRLELRNTTLGGILDALLSQAGMKYEIEEGEIHLVPEAAAAQDRTSSSAEPAPQN